jgi:hypothetical protein
MPKPVTFKSGITLSISSLADEFGCARETLRKRLDDAAVQPAEQRGGYPVYRMRDALRAWIDSLKFNTDPDELEPFQRKAHYQAEREKLELQTERGELIPRIEVEREQARILSILVRTMDTLPDILERDCGATPAQLEKIERICDHIREQMYGELTQNEDADSAVRESA